MIEQLKTSAAAEFKPICMWLLGIPVAVFGTITWLDVETVFRSATVVVGFLTSLTGLAIGICGFIWWLRKLKK